MLLGCGRNIYHYLIIVYKWIKILDIADFQQQHFCLLPLAIHPVHQIGKSCLISFFLKQSKFLPERIKLQYQQRVHYQTENSKSSKAFSFTERLHYLYLNS